MRQLATCPHCADRAPTRRSVVTGLAAAAVVPALAASAVAEASDQDTRFMRIAIAEARRADYPFGTVIVRDGELLVRGRNLGRATDDPTAHGEMVAIRRCVARHGSKAMRGATLYTSGEPCVMCAGAIVWCGFSRLVFAASVEQIAAKMNQITVSSAEIAAKAPFAKLSITGGVLADEAVKLFG
jgi:tRNA(adenine34) deaminase